MSVAAKFRGRMRRIRGVAVDHAIAVIHGADECLLPALLAFAPASAVAAVVHRRMGAAIAAIAVLGNKAILARRLGLGLLGRMGLAGACPRLAIGMAFRLVVRVSLTSAAPATMPLPFSLTCRLGLIRSAEPGVDFALLSCMHIPVRWQFLQPAQLRPTPDRGRQR